MLAVDELAAGLERNVVEAVIPDGPDASAETIAGFEHVDIGAAIDEAARRGQSRESAAADEDACALERRASNETGTTR